MLAPVEGLSRFLAEEARREPAASSPGCWRPASRSPRTPGDRRSRSTAGACTERSTGSTGTRRPHARPRLQALGQGHPARRSSRRRRSCSCSSTCWPSPSSGGRRRSAASTTRCGAPRSAGRGGWSSRTRPRQLAGYGSRAPTRSTRSSRSCSPTPAAAPARSSPGCAPADRPRPRPAAGPARTTAIARPFCDFAPICRRDRAPVEPAGDEDEEER